MRRPLNNHMINASFMPSCKKKITSWGDGDRKIFNNLDVSLYYTVFVQFVGTRHIFLDFFLFFSTFTFRDIFNRSKHKLLILIFRCYLTDFII